MKTIVILTLVLMVGFGQCGHSRDQSSWVGTYDLQGRDYSGTLIFNGAISIASHQNNELRGMCKVVKVTEAFEGVVNKDGPCEGKVAGDRVTLYLAPNLSDGGLVFEGHWMERRITGTWMIESMAGGRTFGTFEAVKQ
ncbi:MAG: hypothetical protein ACREA9_19520 [Pyrinomonadaceae bacterium]